MTGNAWKRRFRHPVHRSAVTYNSALNPLFMRVLGVFLSFGYDMNRKLRIFPEMPMK
nr:MAG TPA: hypothetical protein [Bacteriophage sp.]